MLAVAFSAIVLWLATVFNAVREEHQQLAEVYQAKQRLHDIRIVAEAIERYYQENHALPVNLSALAATPSFAGISAHFNSWLAYGISPQLTDGTWRFQRAVVFMQDPSRGVTAAAYLAQNTCGAQGYDIETTSWCGSKNSMWYVKDTRQALPEQIMNQRMRLNRLSQKFADYFNVNRSYPNKDAANVLLANGSITSLAFLAGYAGGAKNCSGPYHYQGIALDCSDMFDLWGGAIGYQFESNKHIILVSESPIFNAQGVPLMIAVDRTA